ncbi:unnamed protein product [Pleuronectes platessa]|uniref:Uncharacterized protein n=1 Tax=Pleuronectes platessa TaxID=8262 RepID=A0A9N7YCB5_PLEPL|nr:unnamed protein product [Pleuronectes platessa]
MRSVHEGPPGDRRLFGNRLNHNLQQHGGTDLSLKPQQPQATWRPELDSDRNTQPLVVSLNGFFLFKQPQPPAGPGRRSLNNHMDRGINRILRREQTRLKRRPDVCRRPIDRGSTLDKVNKHDITDIDHSWRPQAQLPLTHLPEKQLLSQDLDTDEASAWSRSWSITNNPRYSFHAPFVDEPVQVQRSIPPVGSMMEEEPVLREAAAPEE